MQNIKEVQTRWIPTKRKRKGKKKNKSIIQVHYNHPLWIDNTLEKDKNKSTFQAPDDEDDNIVELTDDHSPNNPMVDTANTSVLNQPGDNLKQKVSMKGQTNNTATQQQANENNDNLNVQNYEAQNLNKEKLDADTSNSEAKSQDLLEGLPEDVRKVVQDKLKTMTTPKKPIIMQINKEDHIDMAKKTAPVSKSVNYIASNPIQVRLLTERRPVVEKKTVAHKTQPMLQKEVKNKNADMPGSSTMPRYSNMPGNFDITGGIHHIKGVPRSLLFHQHQGSIQPRPDFESQSNMDLKYGEQQTHNVQSAYAPMNNAPVIAETQPLYNENVPGFSMNMPVSVDTNIPTSVPQAYSPSDIYLDTTVTSEQDAHEGSESPDLCQQTQKRLSAFQRLGPLTQPKKPKLTINLQLNNDQAVREVIHETDEVKKIVPVHLRDDIIKSTDDTVVKFLQYWPWKKNVVPRKSVTARISKSVMLMEQEQMEEYYAKNNLFLRVTVKGYPSCWKKEDVLDTVIESTKSGLIPCFIEFTPDECKFLVIRSRSALYTLHKMGFIINKGEVKLNITVCVTDITLSHLDFIPKLILRKRLSLGYDSERKLNLSAFTLKSDISHFIYYPLNYITNQTSLIQMQSVVAWDYLTELDLSNNRLTSIIAFDLPSTTPRLKDLDLSCNNFEKVTLLLSCRNLSLNSIKLEGNPLCHDYIDSEHYIKVIKMIFPTLKKIDGIALCFKGNMPKFKRNYCPEAATGVVEKFLEVYFPLLDSPPEDRMQLQHMYDEDAIMTVTCRYKLRYGSTYRYFRNLFLRCRAIDEGEMESIEGAAAIAKHLTKWPALKHDPYTFTVDVLCHNDTTTIIRIGGIVKLTSESLAEDEHLLAFTKTLVLETYDGAEYKITNDMVYWEEPTEEYANAAFQINTVRSKSLSLNLESAPDEDLKEKLVNIFMELTELEKKSSERCLEMKDWHLKNALEHFVKLLKLDNLDSLKVEECET